MKAWLAAIAAATLVNTALSATPAAAGTRPNTTIKAGASGLVASATATFKFKSSKKGSTFKCRMDGGRWRKCTSPKKYTGLGQGGHTFAVRATKDGKVDRTPATRTFTVDTVAPETTVDSGPTGVVDDHTPTFVFSSSEAATFSCRFGSAAFTPCASPFDPAAMPDDLYTFEVVARDAAGNADSTPAGRTFEILTPITRDLATAQAAADFYFPADADLDIPASCGSPAVDCPGGVEAPPTDQVHLTSTKTVTEVVGASRFDVAVTADVSTLAPILVSVPLVGDCNLSMTSANGSIPTWTISFPMSFVHPPGSTEWRIVPGEVSIANFQSDDVVLSGAFGCALADLGVSFFIDTLKDTIASALVSSSLCAASGPPYLGPCPD